jgi:G:T-mismatch repair DNA endonuclease (very short patch repair protein)
MQGAGCPKCKIEKIKKHNTVSASEFLQRAKIKFGNSFEYNLKEYENFKCKPITITCHLHGNFVQKPNNHLKSKSGCPSCSIKQGARKRSLSWKEVVNKSSLKHKNKYTYPDFNKKKYKNGKTLINIICSKHGLFVQRAEDHIFGHGCQKCYNDNQKLPFLVVLKRFIEIHGLKYSYDEKTYSSARKRMSIICFKHGSFEQTPEHHFNGRGCPKCSLGKKISKGQRKLYNIIKQRHPKQKIEMEYKIIINKDKKVFADVFMPEKNAIIEYYGDYWHCNPKKYKPDYFHPHKKTTAMAIWSKDEKRKMELESLGYEVFIVWENDLKHDKNILKESILAGKF